jgi:hypothetical protein
MIDANQGSSSTVSHRRQYLIPLPKKTVAETHRFLAVVTRSETENGSSL